LNIPFEYFLLLGDNYDETIDPTWVPHLVQVFKEALDIFSISKADYCMIMNFKDTRGRNQFWSLSEEDFVVKLHEMETCDDFQSQAKRTLESLLPILLIITFQLR
jgi:hypothetical protein